MGRQGRHQKAARVSSGHRGTGCASTGAVINLISREPGLRNFLGRMTLVSRKWLVPYGAGRSSDGETVYIDQNVPERFRMGIEPEKYAAAHEGFEWWLMTRKGLKYWEGDGVQSAHWWATGFEHYQLMLDGWQRADIDAYETEWLTYIAEDEAERLSPETVPPDLYTGPYEEGMDEDPGEEEISAKILPILRMARMQAMPVRAVETR